jgi:hypothetical protein
LSGLRPESGLDNLDTVIEALAKDLRAAWLRFHSDDACTEARENRRSVTHVRTDVEAEATSRDELSIEARPAGAPSTGAESCKG